MIDIFVLRRAYFYSWFEKMKEMKGMVGGMEGMEGIDGIDGALVAVIQQILDHDVSDGEGILGGPNDRYRLWLEQRVQHTRLLFPKIRRKDTSVRRLHRFPQIKIR